jgi:hypothetical protein
MTMAIFGPDMLKIEIRFVVRIEALVELVCCWVEAWVLRIFGALHPGFYSFQEEHWTRVIDTPDIVSPCVRA